MSLFLECNRLLEGFRNGDQEALARVYRHYCDDIENLVTRGFASGAGRQSRVPGIGQPETKRDIVQDIFIRAFSESARMGYDGLRPYKPYLFTIACNVIIDHWRAAPRDVLSPLNIDFLNSVSPDNYLEEVISQDPEPTTAEDDLDWQRCMDSTRDYLSKQSEMMQRFVQLRFVRELPQLDVAKEMKLSRWRIRSLEKKAQNGLRKHLKKRGFDDMLKK